MACEHGIEPDKFCFDCSGIKDAADRMVAYSLKTWGDTPGALRCALGDAAALCDVLADATAKAHKGNRGRGAVTKQGRELQAAMKRCGDAIWAMREKVVVPR